MSYNTDASRLFHQAVILASLGETQVAKEALRMYEEKVYPKPKEEQSDRNEDAK